MIFLITFVDGDRVAFFIAKSGQFFEELLFPQTVLSIPYVDWFLIQEYLD